MLAKGKHHVEHFCVFIGRRKTTHIAIIFIFCCLACALQLPNFCLHCSLMHSQASRLQRCNFKHFHNCMKVLSPFRTPCCTNLQQHTNRPKRGGAHVNAQTPFLQFSLPTSQTPFLQFSLPTSAPASVCCNSHVQENKLSLNRFTQYKAKPYLGFQNSGSHYKILGCHFDTQKRLKNTPICSLMFCAFLLCDHRQYSIHASNPMYTDYLQAVSKIYMFSY